MSENQLSPLTRDKSKRNIKGIRENSLFFQILENSSLGRLTFLTDFENALLFLPQVNPFCAHVVQFPPVCAISNTSPLLEISDFASALFYTFLPKSPDLWNALCTDRGEQLYWEVSLAACSVGCEWLQCYFHK